MQRQTALSKETKKKSEADRQITNCCRCECSYIGCRAIRYNFHLYKGQGTVDNVRWPPYFM